MKAVHREAATVLALAVLAAVLWLTGTLIIGRGHPVGGSQRLEDLVGLAASVAGLVLISWWAAALVLAFASEVLRRAGHRAAAHRTGACSPDFMRRLAAALLGVHLVAGAQAAAAQPLFDPAPASAVLNSTIHPAWSPHGSSAGQDRRPPGHLARNDPPSDAVPDPLHDAGPVLAPQWQPVPAPADGGLLLGGDHRPARNHIVAGAEVVVAPGDSLWSIASRHLGEFATDVEIAHAWPEWHRINFSVIGNDPDFLLPGQLLRVPGNPSHPGG